jgi:signal transduction histidine kinase
MEDHEETLTPGARELLNRIAKTALRMDQLTQDLLAYTRVSRGELTLSPVDLDHVLSEVVEQYPAILRMKHRITIHHPLGVVAGHSPSLIQIFSNLIENALKFVQQGQEPVVDIKAVREGEKVRVTVSDRGVGIAPEQQERIFGIFERVSRSPFPGTGIGLAIAKKAVERMGGAIGVQSALNQGAVFWVLLNAAHSSSDKITMHKRAGLEEMNR